MGNVFVLNTVAQKFRSENKKCTPVLKVQVVQVEEIWHQH